ncbi:IS110 family transposase, partial [Paenibacillus dendritiformis]
MEVLLERCAGMDVHQETIVVCVMTTDAAGEAHSEIRTFGTMTKHLFELLKYLESQGVTHIAMESTGIYWKPVYNILEGY